MAAGTGQGAVAIFSNVPTFNSFNCRMRRVGTLQGISREPVDYSDLETSSVMDIRPGDLLSPGTFDLEFLADGNGTESNRPSPAEISALLGATNLDLTLTISFLLDNTQMTSTGFVSDHDGPDLETNTPMAYRLTWQSTAPPPNNTPPTWS
jgi:hypothetical protein